MEDARVQPHHSCEPMDPELLRALVNGDLILFKRSLGIEPAPTSRDGNSAPLNLFDRTLVLIGARFPLVYFFNTILAINQTRINRDLESILVPYRANRDLLRRLTRGGDTALHVVAGAIEKPRRMTHFSEGFFLGLTMPGADGAPGAGLLLPSAEIVVSLFFSIIVSLVVSPVKVFLFLFANSRIFYRRTAAAPINTYFPVNVYFHPDYAEFLDICFSFVKKITLGIESYQPISRIPKKRNMYLEIAEIIYRMDPRLLHACNCAMNETPLHCAAKAGKLEMVSHLIQFACQEDQLKHRPEVLLQMFRAKNQVGETALQEAARSGYSDIVRLLLDVYVELANHRDVEDVELANCWVDIVSPLYLAVVSGCLDAVRVLIDTRAPTSYAGPDGQTALHAAVMRLEVLLTSTLNHPEKRTITINSPRDSKRTRCCNSSV